MVGGGGGGEGRWSGGEVWRGEVAIWEFALWGSCGVGELQSVTGAVDGNCKCAEATV